MAKQAKKKSDDAKASQPATDTQALLTLARQMTSALPASGNDETELPPRARSVVGQLMDELEQVKEELLLAQKRVVELEHRADEDVLLPVLNRRGFDRELERTLAYVARHGTDVCLVFIDLDYFKGVNDTYGHAAGDAALRHLTDIILANTRRSDVVARIGGDEFALLLYHADEQAGLAKAEQLSRALKSSGAVFGGEEIKLSLTAGVTQLSGDDSADAALERADQKMYEGKARRTPKQD